MQAHSISSLPHGSRMLQVNVAQLHDDQRATLSLAWIAGRDGGGAVRREAAASAALIGHLNLTHPNSVQVIGAYEASMLSGPGRVDFAEALFRAGPAAVILADGVGPTPELVEHADRTHTPLFTSPQPAARVIETLARYLSKALADITERHGVFMDVLGLGVLITGESGVGKSELGLELISRGHGLVADDVVDISRIAVNTLEGRSPALLRDFLEVRGLGLLNIRTIFGETAIRPRMRLRLIAHLERPSPAVRETVQRLPLAELSEEILGVTIRKVIIPVAAGRNLAVLLEAAIRNHILQLRGIDSTAEFMARQKAAMERGG
jgi:HPr kinase/phosphorylase